MDPHLWLHVGGIRANQVLRLIIVLLYFDFIVDYIRNKIY